LANFTDHLAAVLQLLTTVGDIGNMIIQIYNTDRNMPGRLLDARARVRSVQHIVENLMFNARVVSDHNCRSVNGVVDELGSVESIIKELDQISRRFNIVLEMESAEIEELLLRNRLERLLRYYFTARRLDTLGLELLEFVDTFGRLEQALQT
jgi:hypothetical protein